MDRMPLGLDELVEHWTVLEYERKLIAGKHGPTRLGFAVLLKFFTQRGRLPSGRSELPDETIEFVARQAKVGPAVQGVLRRHQRQILRQGLGLALPQRRRQREALCLLRAGPCPVGW